MEKRDEAKESEKKPETEKSSVETTLTASSPVQETPETEEAIEEDDNGTSHFSEIYSNIASNGYENLRTSYIENKAKALRKKRK